LLKPRIAHRDGSSRTVELELHDHCFYQSRFPTLEHQAVNASRFSVAEIPPESSVIRREYFFCTFFCDQRQPKEFANPKLIFNRCSVSPGRRSYPVGIYVYMRGRRRGPYPRPQLEAMWQRGEIPTDTFYWHEGMSKWKLIEDLFAER
jgi:uncharacterized protein DUF4339